MKNNLLMVEKEMVGRRPTWKVVHVPTDRLIGRYPLCRIARAVHRAMLEAFGGILDTADPDQLIKDMHHLDTGLVRWVRVADDWPDRAQWEAHLEQEREAEAALELERKKWEGQVFHYIEGSMHYGRQGKILSVQELDPPDCPERIVCSIEWNAGHSSLGRALFLESISLGPAPENMPWSEIRRGWEWRARIKGGIYCIGRVGSNYVLWNKDVPIGHQNLPEYKADLEMVFPSLDAAQQAALEYAPGGCRSRQPRRP